MAFFIKPTVHVHIEYITSAHLALPSSIKTKKEPKYCKTFKNKLKMYGCPPEVFPWFCSAIIGNNRHCKKAKCMLCLFSILHVIQKGLSERDALTYSLGRVSPFELCRSPLETKNLQAAELPYLPWRSAGHAVLYTGQVQDPGLCQVDKELAKLTRWALSRKPHVKGGITRQPDSYNRETT